jgi:allantoinase
MNIYYLPGRGDRLETGLEFIGHGMHQKSIQQAGTEEEVVAQTLAKLRGFSGHAVTGWLSPGLRETERSPDILKAEGVRYVLD